MDTLLNQSITLPSVLAAYNASSLTQPYKLDTVLEIGFWNSYLELAQGLTSLNSLFCTLKICPRIKLVDLLESLVYLIISYSYSRDLDNLRLGVTELKYALTQAGYGYSISCIDKYLSFIEPPEN